VNSSSTQDTARTILNSVSQGIQFSGNVIYKSGPVGSPSLAYYFCVGGATYFYIPGVKYDATATLNSSNPGLYMDPGGCSSTPNFSNSKGKELLGNAMRVTYLSVQPLGTTNRLYTISLGIAYGDSDLLCNHSIASGKGSCQHSSTAYAIGDVVQGTDQNDVVCKPSAGSQFCAHAGLTTTVSLRVASSELQP
jgi:hypothetical protein